MTLGLCFLYSDRSIPAAWSLLPCIAQPPLHWYWLPFWRQRRHHRDQLTHTISSRRALCSQLMHMCRRPLYLQWCVCCYCIASTACCLLKLLIQPRSTGTQDRLFTTYSPNDSLLHPRPVMSHHFNSTTHSFYRYPLRFCCSFMEYKYLLL